MHAKALAVGLEKEKVTKCVLVKRISRMSVLVAEVQQGGQIADRQRTTKLSSEARAIGLQHMIRYAHS
jgi:hypothetical protein